MVLESLNCGHKSHSEHGCVPVFLLPYVDRGFVTGQSPICGVVQNV